MSLQNDVGMEKIPLEDSEQDSIEFRILMAYAQRRLSASRYKKLQNEAKVPKSSSLIRSDGETHHQRDKGGPSKMSELQQGMKKQRSKKQPKQKLLSRYCLPFLCSRAEQENPPKTRRGRRDVDDFSTSDESHQKRSCQVEPRTATEERSRVHPQLHDAVCEDEHLPAEASLTTAPVALRLVAEAPAESCQPEMSSAGEKADVDHIADKLAELVTSRPQPPPSNVTFKVLMHNQSLEQDGTDTAGGNEAEGNDEENTIQTIVALLRKSGDQLEEKFKKDRTFYQRFQDMLSYAFFERLTDTFLEDVSADATNGTESQLQCTKVAFALEVATRLTAVDNHPMNLVMGFGLKYLRAHFSPWIRDQGGWEKALSSLDQEEVE